MVKRIGVLGLALGVLLSAGCQTVTPPAVTNISTSPAGLVVEKCQLVVAIYGAHKRDCTSALLEKEAE